MQESSDDIKMLFITSKLKKDYIASTWNEHEINILKIWAEKASGWAWLHDKASRHYHFQGNSLIYPCIFLNTVAGSLGFFNGGESVVYIQYSIAIMNIAAAILVSFQKFIRPVEYAELHTRFFSVFSSYTRKISLELSLNPSDRKDCVEFCKTCRDEYDKAVSESPPIPECVIREFKRTFTNENKPEVANGLYHFEDYWEKINNNGNKVIVPTNSNLTKLLNMLSKQPKEEEINNNI